MHYNIRTVLYGPEQIGCAECVVDNQGQSVSMCDIGYRFDVDYVAVWVSQCFNKYGLCIWAYRFFEIFYR